MIRSLERSISVLLVEHDLAAAFSIADRVTAMDQGVIVADGTPEELRQGSALTGIVAVSRSTHD
jgi:branched-chain amino acid transport system ATP-binding protein